jgi:hypothetical protein
MEFSSWCSYWPFRHAVVNVSRFARTADVQVFLEAVRESSKRRQTCIARGALLWRAQVGCAYDRIYDEDDDFNDLPVAFPANRMRPLDREATEGRANPKGIPVLYLATDRDTAAAEVRPWVGANVSIGQFRVCRDLTIVDCALGDKPGLKIYPEEPDPAARENAVWAHIDQAFSLPVNPSDRQADYAPTQVLADEFKALGLDGVRYRSALGAGFNLALFDLDAAALVGCGIFGTTGVTVEIVEQPGGYRVKAPPEPGNAESSEPGSTP